MSFGLWSAVCRDDVAALVWSVDVNEFRAQAGISQSGGAQRAQRHESAAV